MTTGDEMPARTPRMGEEQAPEGAAFVTDVLADNLRAFRLLRRMEQDGVAEQMNYLGQQWTRQTISDIERGRRNVSVEELVGFTLVLGATIEQLLDPRGPERRTGPRLALARGGKTWGAPRQVMEEFTVDPADVSGLVCEHKVRAWSRWQGAKLREVGFTDVEEPER
jgi:transcriptional regulator with XRE-family HTH domain